MSKQTFDFSEALKRMSLGKKVKRKVWKIKGMYLEKESFCLRKGKIIKCTTFRLLESYNPIKSSNQEDMNATDWEEVEG